MVFVIGRGAINRWFLIGLLLFTSLLESTKAQDKCASELQNQVVSDGQPAEIYSANTTDCKWCYIPSSDAFNYLYEITNTSGDFNSPYEEFYSVNSTTLGINTATGQPIIYGQPGPDSTAGVYILLCHSCVTAANVATVVNGGPSCNCDPTNQLVDCTITYAESSLQPCYPTMTWTDNNNNFYSSATRDPVRNTYDYTSVSQLPITSDGASEYTCQVTFRAPPPDPAPFLAMNAPTYIAQCSITNCLNRTATKTTTQTTTTATIDAKSIQIQPTHGPAAGGTIVTITSNWLNNLVFLSAVYIGEEFRAYFYSESEQIVLMKTLKIDNEQLINQQLPITLELSPGRYNISTGQFFTYKPNPGVEDVNPKVLVISGGIHLNVTGYSLSSVAQPSVRASTIIWSLNGTTTYYNKSFAPCYPPTENGTQMICVSPPIYIRDDFLQQLFGETDPYSNNRRRRDVIDDNLWRDGFDQFQMMGTSLIVRSKRSESSSISTNRTYISENGHEMMRIYLGIVFDGYERYKENILLDSAEDFKVTYPPSILCKGDIEFDPGQSNNSTITIQGDKMLQCCQLIDYTIRIGDGFCNATSLTENALTCSPPKVKPQQKGQDKLYCGKKFAIFVDLGIKIYKCSCLSYSDDNRTTVIIIAATTVGSTLLLVVSIIVTTIIIRKCRKSKITSRQLFADVMRRQPVDTKSVNSTDYNDSVSCKNETFKDYADPSMDEVHSSQLVPDHYERSIDHSIAVYSNSAEINYLAANEID